MQLTRKPLHHINVLVPNLDESEKYYTEVLGYDFKARYELNNMKFVFVTDGINDYELIENTSLTEAKFDHIAYRSTDIKADYEYFKNLDPTLLKGEIGEADFSEDFGLYYFFINGSNGEKIEFCQDK